MVAGQLAGNAFELLAIGQGVVHDDEQLLQLDRDLYDRGENYHEGALLLAGDKLSVDGLNHFRIVEEPVKVVEQQQGRAVALGERRQGAERGQRIAGATLGMGTIVVAGQAQAAGNVPDGELPAALTGVQGDLTFGLVGLERLDPQSGYVELHITGFMRS